MTKHKAGTREEWLKARKKLLEAEKEHTRRGDELAKQRMQLPWVRIEKQYQFDTDEGKASLMDLFKGRSQLLVYHFMYGPDYTAGCPHCSSIADSFNGSVPHLANHDVMFWAVSRAPIEKLLAFRKRMGWSFLWASSGGNDFNNDFHVAFTEQQQRTGDIEYNFRKSGVSAEQDVTDQEPDFGKELSATVGTNWATYIREAPGMSAFALQDGEVYHTYSAYARGLDAMWGVYQWLDRAPLGRNEQGVWMKHHDKYESDVSGGKMDCCS